MDAVKECRQLFWMYIKGELSYEEMQVRLSEIANKQITLF